MLSPAARRDDWDTLGALALEWPRTERRCGTCRRVELARERVAMALHLPGLDAT